MIQVICIRAVHLEAMAATTMTPKPNDQRLLMILSRHLHRIFHSYTDCLHEKSCAKNIKLKLLSFNTWALDSILVTMREDIRDGPMSAFHCFLEI
jgi:hypothetical protein